MKLIVLRAGFCEASFSRAKAEMRRTLSPFHPFTFTLLALMTTSKSVFMMSFS